MYTPSEPTARLSPDRPGSRTQVLKTSFRRHPKTRGFCVRCTYPAVLDGLGRSGVSRCIGWVSPRTLCARQRAEGGNQRRFPIASTRTPLLNSVARERELSR
jgi:hypothetical protein